MYPGLHKRQMGASDSILERDRNIARVPWTAERPDDDEIQRIPESLTNELKAMNRTSFLDALHAKLGSCGLSQAIAWKNTKLRSNSNTTFWKHACDVDDCLGRSWSSGFFYTASEAREACAYKILKYLEYIQAVRPPTAGRQTSFVTNTSQQASHQSQAYDQLQNGNTPTVPTIPGAVEAFTQHVKVGSAPFYIFPDLRPLLQAGVATTEAHPSSYDERGHCVLGSRDQIAAQIIAEPFKRMRFLGNEDHHNLGLAAIVSFVADGDDFQQAAPADRGNYFAVLIRSLIRGACANGHMTTDDCYRVLGAMVETHFGVTLAVATEQNAGAQQPGLAHGQWSAFPPENANFSSSSTHPTRCPQSQPGFVSSVDTGKWVPNAPSGVFLAQDMDLDSPASTPTQTPGPGFSGKDTQPGAAAQAGGSSQTGGSKQVENGAGDLKSGLRQPPANTTPHPRRPPPPQVPAQPAQPAVAPSHVPPQFESFISGVRSGAPLPRFPTSLARPQPFVFGAPTPMGSSQAPATQKFQFGATAPMTPQAVPVFQNAPQPVPATTSNAQEPGPAPARTFESARQDSKVAASLQNLFNNR